MKLLYLYIENYHRVHQKRGINFDSNYRFEFDGRCLSFTRRHVVPKKFFAIKSQNNRGGRVECVSAIIGENGTGKTSVMSFINETFGGGRSNPDRRFLYVLRGKFGNDNHATYRCYDNFEGEIEFAFPEKYRDRWRRIRVGEDQMLPVPPVRVIYFSPYYTTQDVLINRGDAFVDISTTGLMHREENAGSPLAKYESDERDRILGLIKRFGTRPTVFGEATPLPCPDSVEVIPDVKLIESVLRNFTRQLELTRQGSGSWDRWHRFEDALDIGEVPDLVLRLCASYVASMGMRISLGENVSTRHSDYFEFLAAETLKCRTVILHESSKRPGAPHAEKPKKHWDRLEPEQRKYVRRALIDGLVKYELPIEQDPYLPGSVEAHAAFVRILDAADRLAISAGEDAVGPDGGVEIGILNRPQQKALYQFLGAYDQVQRGGLADGKFNFVTLSYGEMSSGEMAYLSLFSRLDELLAPKPKDGRLADARDLIVFLDEAETTLHPEWQRQLVANVIWYFENFTQGLRVHVIFASHSPMLLSDIPRDNVCFLDPKRSDEGVASYQCDWKRLSNTFGANVYDLYRLSFGLDRGVYGCLAESRIQYLKRKIQNGEVLSSDDEKLGQLIGDELIRVYLTRGVNETHST